MHGIAWRTVRCLRGIAVAHRLTGLAHRLIALLHRRQECPSVKPLATPRSLRHLGSNLRLLHLHEVTEHIRHGVFLVVLRNLHVHCGRCLAAR